MNDKIIKNIYNGLPEELKKDDVFWIKDEYRTNPLSIIPGGNEVIVEYNDGNVLGYDKVKNVTSYIEAILRNTVEEELKERDKEQDEENKEIVISSSYGESKESNIKIIKEKLSSIYYVKRENKKRSIIAFIKLLNTKVCDDPYKFLFDNFSKYDLFDT